jgi:hypothetical protein
VGNAAALTVTDRATVAAALTVTDRAKVAAALSAARLT